MISKLKSVILSLGTCFLCCGAKFEHSLKILIVNKNDLIVLLPRSNVGQVNEVQQLHFHQELLVRDIIIGGLAVVLLFLAVLHNRSQLNYRNNVILESQKADVYFENTALRACNDKQALLLKEREWLLREIHHRVKNNLQVMMSLLNVQSTYLNNPQALTAIRDSQRRIHVMSLIHDKLYQADSLAYIDMSDYIPELVSFLKESFGNGDNIYFDLKISAIQLDVSQALPLSLILNEGITNAMKYAFCRQESGKMTISLVRDHHHMIHLSIADNGVGLPENFNYRRSESLGMNLMSGLSEQIDGTFRIDGSNGTNINIRFKNSNIIDGAPTFSDGESFTKHGEALPCMYT